MKNFKEIAEKCLAGELSGTFVIRGEKNWHSSTLSRHMIAGHEIPGQYVIGPGVIYNEIGQCESIERIRIIDFIPDNMQEQIKIDIPEGMTVIREETPGEIKIKFVKKQLTYDDIWESLDPKLRIFPFATPDSNKVNDTFFDKVNVLRKLTNIRNYFGKPDSYDRGYCIKYSRHQDCLHVGNVNTIGNWIYDVLFKEKEHAEQAIKMLGDELKYLFEPW